MARREGSAAATPPAAPAAAPAPAPAAPKAARVPEFAAPASPEQPIVTKWDSYADDDGGMPSGEPSTPTAQPDTRDKVKINAEGVPVAEAKPQDDGDGLMRPGEMPTETPETPAEEAPKPKAAARRRAVLDALAGESRLRGLEGQLTTERAEHARVAALLRGGSLGEILKARGIDRDAALEALATGTEGAPPAETVEEKPKWAREIEEDNRRLKGEIAQAREAEGLAAVEREMLGVESAPVVHAAIRSGAVVDYDAQTGRPLTAAKLIANAALIRWRAEGSVPGEQQKHVREATEALEYILIERHEPIVAAITKKRGGTPKPADPPPAVRAATPGIGRRIAARPDARPAPLPMDREARDLEIKRRNGWA